MFRKSVSRAPLAALLLGLAGVLSACGGGGDDSPPAGGGGSNPPPPPPPAAIAVTGVSFSALAGDGLNIGLEVGDTSIQTATVAPDNATNKNLTWESSAPAIASVTGSGANNATGTITAVAPGSAQISVKSVDGAKTAALTVSVTAPAPPPQIASYTPTTARYGERITITGANFSTTPLANTVTFNGHEGTVTAATATSLTVTVPKNLDASGPVQVKVAGQTATASAAFTYQITYTVSVFAGTGTAGYRDGAGSQAMFDGLGGIAFDRRKGNRTLYVADDRNHSIRSIDPDGTVATVASRKFLADGFTNKFVSPVGVATDFRGNLFVTVGHMIHRLERQPNNELIVTWLAGNPSGGSGADDGHCTYDLEETGGNNCIAGSFNSPRGLVMDSKDNLYIVDQLNHSIRKVTPNLAVSTVVGGRGIGYLDGTGLEAQFRSPWGINVDSQDNLYVTDRGNNRIRKITFSGADAVVTTLAGSGAVGANDGPGATATFLRPSDVAVDAADNVYVMDTGNHLIRKITPDGVVSTLVRRSDFLSASGNNDPNYTGIAIDPEGNIYVSDSSGSNNNGSRILKATPER
jgi:sugar lactone lactonase YvrE